MKHFAKENWYEVDAFHSRRHVKYNASSLAETKHLYRRRERALLKRMTAELVDDELEVGVDERRFWERQLDNALQDWYNLESAELHLRDSGKWRDKHVRAFAAAYRETSKRANAAYDEWFAAA